MPALRERLSDIPILVETLAARIYEKFGWKAQQIAPEAISLLAQHDWSRNNVRELRNAVERMILTAGQGPVDPHHVPDIPRADRSRENLTGAEQTAERGTLREQKSASERRIVLEALEAHGWQITRTAEALGHTDHSSLIKIMRRHGLKR